MTQSHIEWYSRGIKCGHCRSYHTDVNRVRFCSQGLPAYSTRNVITPPPPPPIPVRTHVQAPAQVHAPVAASVTSQPAQLAASADSWFDELQVPPGRYAVENNDGELRFYIVRENTNPKYKRYRKVLVQASDNEIFIKGCQAKKAILSRILEVGLEIASLRYGLELGVCGVCGRTLTDETSRAMGIGPVCREKMGWL